MPLAGFEPAIPASEWAQTHAVDRAGTWIGLLIRVYIYIYIYIYMMLTAIGLTPAGSSTVHIYTPTTHRTTQRKQTIQNIHINKNT